jgi:acyl-CoA thioester hydrolase
MSRGSRATRDEYRFFHAISTRWMDNDVYGHINNVEFYSFFDTAVGAYLISRGIIEIATSPIVGIVVENGCRFHVPIAFPDLVTVGIRVARLGASSVRYEIGVFRNDEHTAAAEGHFVHVFVERATMRPVAMPDAARHALSEIAATAAT